MATNTGSSWQQVNGEWKYLANPVSNTSPTVIATKNETQPATGKSWQQINGSWTYANNAPSISTPTPEVKPAPAVYSSSAAKTDYTNNQEVLKKAEENITNYSQLQNRGGTIYNGDKGYSNPEELAKDMGVQSNQIDWSKIGTNQVIKPTGNVALDSKVSEINQTLSQPYTGTVIDAYNARPDVQAEIKRAFPGQDPFTQGTDANRWLNDWWNQTGAREMSQSQSQSALNVKEAEEAYTTAVANAKLAEDGGNLLAFRESIKALQEAQVTRQEAINKLYEEQKAMRQQYITSLMPTSAENDLNTQLNNLRAQIDQTELNRDAGILKTEGQTIAQSFITGQSAAIQKQANLSLQTLAAKEENLLNRLGLAQSNRQANTEALNAGMTFLSQDIEMQIAAQDKLQEEEDKIVERFDKYQETQKTDAAAILKMLNGVDPSNFSPETEAKIAQIASSLGISPTDINNALKLQYDQYVLEQAKERASLENIQNPTNSDYENWMLAGGENSGYTYAEWIRGREGIVGGEEGGVTGTSEATTQATANVTSSEALAKASNLLGNIQDLQAMDWGQAVGAIKSTLPGWVAGGNERNAILNKINTIKGLLTIENMGIMKGVLSDSDMKVIASASTSLNANTDTNTFDRELKKIKMASMSVVNSPKLSIGQVMDNGDGTYSYKNLDGTVHTGMNGDNYQDTTTPADPDPFGILESGDSLGLGFKTVGGDTNKATLSKVVAKSNGANGGQCGRFVNSITGLGLGDSYTSKMSKMDKNLKVAKPGMVFVMPYKNTGHTGFIVGIDGKNAIVKDSNWGLDEKISTHTIPLSKITGLRTV